MEELTEFFAGLKGQHLDKPHAEPATHDQDVAQLEGIDCCDIDTMLTPKR